MIKSIIKLFVFFVFILVVVCPIALLVTAIEKKPAVGKSPELSFDNVKRVEQLIRQYKPRYMRFKQVRRISVLEDDLNLLVNYGVSQLTGKDFIYPEIFLSAPLIYLRATVKIPSTPLGEYVNPELVLKLTHDKPDIAYLGLGKIKIPGQIIKPLASFLGTRFLSPEIYDQLIKNLDGMRSVSIRQKRLSLIYEWNPETLTKLHESGKTLLVSPAHQTGLILYTNELSSIAAIVKEHQVNPISLSRVIRSLFQLAADQSRISGDPVMENRALLQALTIYCLGETLEHLVNEERLKELKPHVDMTLSLYGRDDLAKHFLVSAGLAVSAGSKLSRFVGLAKEVDDSAGGSGFSFADLAADRAGVRLGELAVDSPGQASRIQQKMAAVKKESEFMPGIDHLPEGIMELQFKKQYTDLDSAAYLLIEDEISRRIETCTAYQ